MVYWWLLLGIEIVLAYLFPFPIWALDSLLIGSFGFFLVGFVTSLFLDPKKNVLLVGILTLMQLGLYLIFIRNMAFAVEAGETIRAVGAYLTFGGRPWLEFLKVLGFYLIYFVVFMKFFSKSEAQRNSAVKIHRWTTLIVFMLNLIVLPFLLSANLLLFLGQTFENTLEQTIWLTMGFMLVCIPFEAIRNIAVKIYAAKRAKNIAIPSS